MTSDLNCHAEIPIGPVIALGRGVIKVYDNLCMPFHISPRSINRFMKLTFYSSPIESWAITNMKLVDENHLSTWLKSINPNFLAYYQATWKRIEETEFDDFHEYLKEAYQHGEEYLSEIGIDEIKIAKLSSFDQALALFRRA